ncbi:MAG: thiol reductant ABC exporter subunit CydD [Nocardioides sp.]|uniref:thiol reductant ABC exporter subunit CydD n=1 Tax=Nocardioides sp. TaxID=35761 RepID=UPI003F10A4E7
MKPLDPHVLGHLRPARGALVAVVVSGLLNGLLTVAQAFVLAALVVGLVTDHTDTVWHTYALVLLAIVLGRALLAWVGDVSADRAAGQVSKHLRRRLLEATRLLPAHRRPDPSELAVLCTRGMSALEPYVTRYLPALVPAVVLPVATVVAIWSQDWIAGLIVVCTLPLVPLFAALIGSVTQDKADRQWRAMATLSGHFLDVVRGLPTLVAHRRATAQVSTIRTVTHRHRRATIETLKVAFASSTVLELIATLSVALVAVAVGLRLAAGNVEFQVALTVLLLAPEAYWPLRRVGAEFHAAAEGTASLAEADALLDQPPASRGTTVPVGTGVQLVDLQVGHPGGPALVAPLTLTLPRSGLVAVTGPSGCGKSTLLTTLRGDLVAAGGEIRIGDVPLSEVDPAWWHAQVAWAPQRPWLLAGTIGDNVRVGRPTASDGDVWEALARVDLAAHVQSLPWGLRTPLGEDGAGLSAGQRARVALARVVLAGRPVVVLDEPTAHLDEETERILLDTLRDLSREALIVTVAHRPAVVEAADVVVALTPLSAPGPAPADAVEQPATVPAPVVPVEDVSDAADRSRWGMATATLLGALSVGSGVALTATAGWLITRASEHPPVLHLMVAIVGVRMFGLARPALRHAERLISHDAVLRDLAERRAAVYEALVPLVPGRLGPRRGDLLTRVVDDVDAVLDATLRVRQPVVTSCLVGLGAAVFGAWLHLPAGGVLALVALAGPLAFVLARTATSSAERRLVAARAELSVRLEEIGSGLGELEQWQAIEKAFERVDVVADDLAAASATSVRGTAGGRALAQAVAGAGVVAMAWATSGHVAGETLALLLLLPLALVDATAPLADAGALSVRTAAARARLDELTRQAPAVTEPVEPLPLPAGHDLRLRGVSAAWDEEVSLAPVDLDLAPGDRVGVVGPSGCGKSTLAAVLMRYLDPASGEYLHGGTDARQLGIDDLRSRVGLVDDDPHVFASTVAENVRLAAPGSTDEQVGAALERAHLGAWVSTLPEGMHTFVGTGHRDVSGGERARIALARAVLADPAVLVLDEPTAHLDSATAAAVTDDLLGAERGADRSVVWITHTAVGLDRMHRVLSLEAPDARDGVAVTRRDEAPAPAAGR